MLKAILEGLAQVVSAMPVIFPAHPRRRKAITRYGLELLTESLTLVEPGGYLDMVMLEKNARLIVTDSGGVQKEAFFYRVPCVTLRYETGWVELVDAGWNIVAPPTSVQAIRTACLESLKRRGQEVPLYGDGHAAEKIVQRLQIHRGTAP